MCQSHARANFHRVAIIDALREKLISDYKARWTGPTDIVHNSPRYRRLCRIVAMYRTAGFLFPQEI